MLKILRAVVDVPHEVLVVFDRDGDDSLTVVEAMAPIYPTIRAVHNTHGPGILNALRAGIERVARQVRADLRRRRSRAGAGH